MVVAEEECGDVKAWDSSGGGWLTDGLRGIDGFNW